MKYTSNLLYCKELNIYRIRIKNKETGQKIELAKTGMELIKDVRNQKAFSFLKAMKFAKQNSNILINLY